MQACRTTEPLAQRGLYRFPASAGFSPSETLICQSWLPRLLSSMSTHRICLTDYPVNLTLGDVVPTTHLATVSSIVVLVLAPTFVGWHCQSSPVSSSSWLPKICLNHPRFSLTAPRTL